MASEDFPPKAAIDTNPYSAEPRVVLGIDRGYASVTASDMAPGERQLVDAVIGAGLDMRCAEGFRRPCIIPPAVALAIVRTLAVPAAPSKARTITALPIGATAVILEGGGTGWLTRDGQVWQRNHPSGFIQVDTKIAPETWGDNEGGQGG